MMVCVLYVKGVYPVLHDGVCPVCEGGIPVLDDDILSDYYCYLEYQKPPPNPSCQGAGGRYNYRTQLQFIAEHKQSRDIFACLGVVMCICP